MIECHVVCLGHHVGDALFIVCETDEQWRRRPTVCERPVVVTGAAADPVAAGIEGDDGHQDDIEILGWDRDCVRSGLADASRPHHESPRGADEREAHGAVDHACICHPRAAGHEGLDQRARIELAVVGDRGADDQGYGIVGESGPGEEIHRPIGDC